MDECKHRQELELLVSLYRQIVKFETLDFEVWLRLAVSLSLLKNEEESASAFRQARQCQKGEAWNAYAQSVEHLFNGQTALAVDAQQKAHRLAPHSPIQQQWAALNLEFCKLGEPDSVIAACQKLLSLSPENAEIWRCLGISFTKAGRHAEAVEALNRCVHLAPDDPNGWQSLIDALWHPDQIEPRLKAHRCFLELEPSNIGGWHSYANALRTAQRLAEEIEASEKIVHLAPRDAEGWKRLSDVYGRAGLHHKKLRAYRQYQKLQSDSARHTEQMELF